MNGLSTGTSESANVSRELFPRDDTAVEQAVGKSVMCTVQEGGRCFGMNVLDDGEEEEKKGCGVTVEANGELKDNGSDLGSVMKAMASLAVSGGRDEEKRDRGEGGRENRQTTSYSPTELKCVIGSSPPLPTPQPMETEIPYTSTHRGKPDRMLNDEQVAVQNAESKPLGAVKKRNTFLLG